MSNIKIAEGKWGTRRKYDIYCDGYFVGTTRNTRDEGNAIDAANAELIADAGNAYQATGLLPSEMAERIEALEKAGDALDHKHERAFTESEVRAIIERLGRETYVWTEWKKKHAVRLLKEHGIVLDPA